MKKESIFYVGVYGIYIKNGSVLMIKKARGPYKGRYDLPGGGISQNEKIEACLVREIMEETNALVISKKLFTNNEYICTFKREDGKWINFHHLGIYYLVKLKINKLKIKPDGRDSNGAVFIKFNQIKKNNTSQISFPVIKKAIAFTK